MIKTNVIDRQVNKGRQDVTCVSYEEINGSSVKLSIKSDSYENQSYARASIFDGAKWNVVYHIHYNEMKTPHKLAYTETNDMEMKFLADLRRLREKTHIILGGKNEN